jgi:hypothetical protein
LEQDQQGEITRICAHKPCRAEFQAEDLRQKYCSPQHGKMARRRKSRAMQNYTRSTIERPGQLCPKPYKKVFVTMKLANEAANNLGGEVEGIRPYRCVCGALHIGHGRR